MSRRLQILTAILAPLVVLGAMVAIDREFGRPDRGDDYVIRVDLPGPAQLIGLPPISGPADPARPLVVIDAGHGGKDPGAGSGALKEKDLTLALALALRDELLAGGGIRVALTRSDDVFLFLGERPELGRRLGADLFLSIHADSTETDNSATGATVYTLSDKGSSEVAERMAARENAADQVNGVKLAPQSDAVGAILVDLSQRGSQAASQEFARLLLREGQGRLKIREDEPQSAAFAVLKSPDVPSVLFEAGYINNTDDSARLNSAAGRGSFAAVTARAIRVFFARQAIAVR